MALSRPRVYQTCVLGGRRKFAQPRSIAPREHRHKAPSSRYQTNAHLTLRATSLRFRVELGLTSIWRTLSSALTRNFNIHGTPEQRRSFTMSISGTAICSTGSPCADYVTPPPPSQAPLTNTIPTRIQNNAQHASPNPFHVLPLRLNDTGRYLYLQTLPASVVPALLGGISAKSVVG